MDNFQDLQFVINESWDDLGVPLYSHGNQPIKSYRKQNTYTPIQSIISSRSMPEQNRTLCKKSILLEVEILIYNSAKTLPLRLKFKKHCFTCFYIFLRFKILTKTCWKNSIAIS